MRIPLTRYGLPEVVVYPLAILAAMVVCAAVVLYGPADWVGGRAWVRPTFWTAEATLLALLLWALMFFRDPHREIPQDGSLWLSPADGTVMDIERVEEPEFIAGPALRIGIFLSIFNTHINRAPCDARIERITYRRGKYLNAMNPLAGKVNESNALAMVRVPSRDARGVSCMAQDEAWATSHEPPLRDTSSEIRDTKFIVRQVSGAIARRIVCAAQEGRQLARGERFGMIKFGSRTELYVAAGEEIECVVRVGDKVKAGVTPLARYTTAPGVKRKP